MGGELSSVLSFIKAEHQLFRNSQLQSDAANALRAPARQRLRRVAKLVVKYPESVHLMFIPWARPSLSNCIQITIVFGPDVLEPEPLEGGEIARSLEQ
jgi:hypothetical protein